MYNFVISFFPWMISLIILFTIFFKNKNTLGLWVFGIIGQILFLIWIIFSNSWGFLFLNLGLFYVSYKQALVWKKEKDNEIKYEGK